MSRRKALPVTMTAGSTLYGVTAAALMSDVYFDPAFVRLHAAPDDIDLLELPGFRHASAVRPIKGEHGEDMETPWGYGGPIGATPSAFWEGIGLWRQRQRDLGRVAEFVRLHPFLNPLALRGFLDDIRFDRLTVLVDLQESSAERRARYSKGTRYSISRAKNILTVRRLAPTDGRLFRDLYEQGLARNNADRAYYFAGDYYDRLLAAPWTHAWVADKGGEALAVACFLRSGPIAHYHLSGGGDRAREGFAQYLLLEGAIETFRRDGCQWMHLGGGRTRAPDDELLRFKTRFSNRCIPFYTGGLVYDRAAYDRMTKGRTDRFLSYRFPPIPDLSTAQVHLDPARATDFPIFFRIKCDVDNIVWSGSDSPPDWITMSSWFQRHVSGTTRRRIFIATCDGRSVGYVYLDDDDNELVVTIGRASGEGGKGLGSAIVVEVLRMLRNERNERPITAWIFPENRAGALAFEAAGFALDETRPPRPFAMPLPDLAPREQRCWVYQGATEATAPSRMAAP